MEYREFPQDIEDGDSFEVKKALCAVCFEEIRQPILNGIWYHGTYSIETKDHEPIPASNVLLLFWLNSKPKRAYERENKKCKKHERYWYKCLGFPRIKKGFRLGHYYNEDGISLCGRILEFRHRMIVDKDAVYPDSTFMNCVNCLKKLEKIGVVRLYSTGFGMSRIRKIKWLKKN